MRAVQHHCSLSAYWKQRRFMTRFKPNSANLIARKWSAKQANQHCPIPLVPVIRQLHIGLHFWPSRSCCDQTHKHERSRNFESDRGFEGRDQTYAQGFYTVARRRSRLSTKNTRNLASRWIYQMDAAASPTGQGLICAGVVRRIRNGTLNAVTGDRTAI